MPALPAVPLPIEIENPYAQVCCGISCECGRSLSLRYPFKTHCACGLDYIVEINIVKQRRRNGNIVNDMTVFRDRGVLPHGADTSERRVRVA